MRFLFLLPLLVALSVIGGRPPRARRIAEGEWGGDHVRLTVTRSGATLDFDCGLGSMSGPLMASADGRFEQMGRYVAERPGPVRKSDDQSGEKARYSGRREGDSLSLSVSLADGQTLGPYQLRRGARGRVTKCR